MVEHKFRALPRQHPPLEKTTSFRSIHDEAAAEVADRIRAAQTRAHLPAFLQRILGRGTHANVAVKVCRVPYATDHGPLASRSRCHSLLSGALGHRLLSLVKNCPSKRIVRIHCIPLVTRCVQHGHLHRRAVRCTASCFKARDILSSCAAWSVLAQWRLLMVHLRRAKFPSFSLTSRARRLQGLVVRTLVRWLPEGWGLITGRDAVYVAWGPREGLLGLVSPILQRFLTWMIQASYQTPSLDSI